MDTRVEEVAFVKKVANSKDGKCGWDQQQKKTHKQINADVFIGEDLLT